MSKAGYGLLGIAAVGIFIIWAASRNIKPGGTTPGANINNIFGLSPSKFFTSNAPPVNPMFSGFPTGGSQQAPNSPWNNIPLGLK